MQLIKRLEFPQVKAFKIFPTSIQHFHILVTEREVHADCGIDTIKVNADSGVAFEKSGASRTYTRDQRIMRERECHLIHHHPTAMDIILNNLC